MTAPYSYQPTTLEQAWVEFATDAQPAMAAYDQACATAREARDAAFRVADLHRDESRHRAWETFTQACSQAWDHYCRATADARERWDDAFTGPRMIESGSPGMDEQAVTR